MKAVLASHNKKKIEEMRRILTAEFPELNLFSLTDIGFFDEIPETGTTFEENALQKARAGASGEYYSIADDSGLEVDALGGRPGVYSARYAGEPCNDEKNNELLLRELASVPDEERTAHYVSVIACVSPSGRSFTVRGTCEGRILRERCGNGGFGYDPLFYVPKIGKTFAEATPAEKDSCSHRGEALSLFLKAFSDFIKGETDDKQ